MRDSSKFIPSGRLDTDTAPEYVAPGNYTDALNVTHITNNTESTQGIVPYLGNDLAFNLGSVATQNKIYRVYTPQVALTGTLTVYDQNGNVITGFPTTWNRNQTLANQAISIDTALTALVGATTTTSGVDYVDIMLTSIAGYDWALTATAGSTPDVALETVVIQEAYDTTLSGELNDIGSYDLSGDLYVWSTPQTNLPTTVLNSTTGLPMVISLSINTTPAPDVYRVTCAGAHGLTSGMKVVISDVTVTSPGIVSPNGIWIINVINSTVFDLLEYYNVTTGMVATANTGKIILYTEAVGEIGVAYKDENLPLPLTNQWTYTRLLRTKEWGFRTKKQVDTYAERNSIKDSIYWTDDYNVPRVMYYNLPYATDGAITVINPTGKYAYGTIGAETKLILSSTNARIEFTSQDQSGGQVTSGNWRYTIRFLSDSLAPTEWADLTNPINVYLAPDNGTPALIIGDEPGTITGKINNFLISGIIPGLFKYVELAGINYVGNGIEGFNIKRVLLTGNDTTLIISHTGTETGQTNLDLGTLNFKEAPITTAKNIDVIDSRMILSNLTVAQQSDLTAWAQTFTYSINRQSLTAVRSAVDGTIVMGEYQDPTNVNMFCGYMHNETYRFGVKVRFKATGFWSDTFWIDDVKFDCTSSGRKTSNLTNFNLTANSGVPGADDICYSAFIGFNITSAILDYLIDGERVRDLVDTISFERAEVVPTILACGMVVLSVYDALVDANYLLRYGTVPNVFGEFPFISGRTSGAPPGGTDPLYTDAEFAGSRERKLAAFYSPDVQFLHTDISFVAGDVLINHGNPFYVSFYNAGGSAYSDQFGQWSGRVQTDGANPPNTITPTSMISMSYGQDIYIFTASGKTYKKQAAFYNQGTLGYSVNYITQSLVFETSTDMNIPVVIPAQEDRGFYYCQYYRPLLNQYGDVGLTKYISVGHTLSIDSSTGSSTQFVFGGDTFTQQNFLRHRTFAQEGIQFTGLPAPTTPQTQGFGGGISFYCQNRINAQMKQKSASQTGNLYPGIITSTWLDSIQNTDGNNGEAYQEGYTIRNQIRSDVAFDSAVERSNDLPVRIVWSELKPQGSPSDRYRIYLPLNFKDLDLSFGEIKHHANGNGELITWQPKKFQRQFFNTRGTLDSVGAGPIVIGDGSVMSRDGQTISLYGTSHKWSVIKGKSNGGNDVFYWIDIILKKALRFGYDGTVSIADIKGMQSFMANNLTWVSDNDTPADGTGICSVWNDRFAEANWTIRGRRDAQFTWNSTTNFVVGSLVFYQPETYSTFEKTGELFIVKFVSGPATVAVTPVAVYPLPNVISTLTGTTVLTITTASPHLLVTGDQVKFRNISGLSADITETFLTATVTGASSFTVTVSALTNSYVGSSGSIVEVNPKYWTFIEHTNNEYYNEYTLIFNEFKNGFTTFATYKPKIFLKWTDTFLSPRPISEVSGNYEHNKGDYLTWYNAGHAGSQTERGYIEGIVNIANDQAKTFVSIVVDSESVPDEVTFTTNTQESYLLSSEFEVNEQSSYSDIKADSTVTVLNPTGLNNTDADLLAGRWLKTKFYFAIDAYNMYLNTLIEFMINFPYKSK